MLITRNHDVMAEKVRRPMAKFYVAIVTSALSTSET